MVTAEFNPFAPGMLANPYPLYRHSVQWGIFGPALPVLYFANEAIGSVLPGPSHCWNVFERQAGLQSGGYDCGSHTEKE